MKWYRRQSTVSKDPFKFLNVASPQDLVMRNPDFRRSRRELLVAGSVLATALIAIVLLTVHKFDIIFGTKTSSFAYIEVKIIDQNGRPVAGAEVSREGEPIGLSDSFGEWRRYLEVKLGEPLKLDVLKNRSGQTLSAHKELEIPTNKPSKGDIEIFSSLQLKNTSASAKGTNVASKEYKKNHSVTRADLEVTKQKTPVEFLESNTKTAGDDSYLASREQVLTELNKLIERDSTKFNHKCDHLTMAYVPHPASLGFIEVTCRGSSGWSVLRNIQSSKKYTAQNLFKSMYRTARMSRTGRSPVVGWQKLSLVFTGNLPKGARVYVSGYPARANKQGYWHYFGRKNSRANLSIVHNGKIIHRQRVTNTPYGARYINLPHKSLARH